MHGAKRRPSDVERSRKLPSVSRSLALWIWLRRRLFFSLLFAFVDLFLIWKQRAFRSGGGTKGRVRASWSKPGSAVFYTSAEVRELTPVRANVEVLAAKRPELRDVFLCHAWDDRQSAAKELNDLLEACGVRVWFSEKDIGLGEPFMRSIDKGLANSRVGIVLVTPAMLRTLPKGGVADKELSALLAGERLVPIVHQTTYDALREVSPLLASRNGLNTAEDTMAGVAAKLAELVTI